MGGEEKKRRTAKVSLKILKGEVGVFLVEMRRGFQREESACAKSVS